MSEKLFGKKTSEQEEIAQNIEQEMKKPPQQKAAEDAVLFEKWNKEESEARAATEDAEKSRRDQVMSEAFSKDVEMDINKMVSNLEAVIPAISTEDAAKLHEKLSNALKALEARIPEESSDLLEESDQDDMRKAA